MRSASLPVCLVSVLTVAGALPDLPVMPVIFRSVSTNLSGYLLSELEASRCLWLIPA